MQTVSTPILKTQHHWFGAATCKHLQVLSGFYQGRTYDDMVERAWHIFDANNKGHITYSSLRSVVKETRQQIDDDELHEMIQCFDKDQDGCISKADFRKILQVYNPDHDPLDDDE